MVLQQIICTIKIRRAPTRHDSIDFRPLITKISELVPLSVVTADKAYDSEDNHVLVRDVLHALSVIPARYEHVPIRKTHGRYRKQMKRGYSKLLYNQRNKNETIVSVIKRLFGEHITSRLVKTQNRELSFRCIAYNIHRLTNLIIISMVSTNPLAQAKKSVDHSTTKASKPAPGSSGGGFAEEPPIGTEPLTPATANNSAASASHRSQAIYNIC